MSNCKVDSRWPYGIQLLNGTANGTQTMPAGGTTTVGMRLAANNAHFAR